MIVLNKRVSLQELEQIEDHMFFDGWIKCVADIHNELLAVNAPMHADLEKLLLDQGSQQSS